MSDGKRDVITHRVTGTEGISTVGCRIAAVMMATVDGEENLGEVADACARGRR
jgi:hypothetical protein